jgi:hypothetical protein
MCHWFFQEMKAQVTMKNLHVIDRSIQHVEKHSMPPLQAPRYARVDTPELVCCINSSHVPCVL